MRRVELPAAHDDRRTRANRYAAELAELVRSLRRCRHQASGIRHQGEGRYLMPEN